MKVTRSLAQALTCATLLSVTATAAYAETAELEILTDIYGNETSVELRFDPDGANTAIPFSTVSDLAPLPTTPTPIATPVVDADGIVDSFVNGTHILTWDNLPSGDYLFAINDSFGDGLNGTGSGYSLSVGGTEVVTPDFFTGSRTETRLTVDDASDSPVELELITNQDSNEISVEFRFDPDGANTATPFTTVSSFTPPPTPRPLPTANANGVIGSFARNANFLLTWENLLDGDYFLAINDSFGDGISSPGGYSFSVGDEVIASDFTNSTFIDVPELSRDRNRVETRFTVGNAPMASTPGPSAVAGILFLGTTLGGSSVLKRRKRQPQLVK
ncbi:MAG: hypothetical protein AAFU71_12780 [Cyanobacteria bacterium J06632_22]